MSESSRITLLLAEWRRGDADAFDQLASEGMVVVPHPFPDHHRFTPADLAFDEPLPILMTAKDAVKCVAFAPADCWEYPVRAQIGSGAAERILEKLEDGRTSA